MFYRLSDIDDTPLPHQLSIGGHDYLVTRGGLLLEPPNAPTNAFGEGEGHSTVKFFGSKAPGEESRFVGSSNEAYRWVAFGKLDISRQESDRGARFTGSVDGSRIQLRAEGGGRFLAPGTRLNFVVAPDQPITSDWSKTFDFGPPHTWPVDPGFRDDPVVQRAIQEFIAMHEPDRVRAARERLESAWRAPA